MLLTYVSSKNAHIVGITRKKGLMYAKPDKDELI